jgi:hypothetical protein
MNKKEQAEMERLKTLLALRHYPAVKPDLMPPESYDQIINGWVFNSYSGTVMKACTSSVSHSIGNWDKTISQQPRRLYSTPKMAYKAMLHEMSMEYARKLRLVEIEMEKCDNEHNSNL